MSDRQNLAEHGVGLCLWGAGAAAVASPIVAGAVVLTALHDMYRRCKHARAKSAVKRARAALEDRRDLPDADINAALEIMRHYKVKIEVDPNSLRDADTRGNFPDELYKTVFAGIAIPSDGRVKDILYLVIAEAWEDLRYDKPTHDMIVQESVLSIEARLREGLDRLELAATETQASVAEGRVENREGFAEIGGKVDGMTALLTDALSKSEKHATQLTERTTLVIALAKRYAEGTPDDFDAALSGLEAALDVAAKQPPGGNLGADVDAIMAEVTALNDEGRIDEGADALTRARAEMRAEEEERAARYLSLLDRSIDQARLKRDPEGAAALAVEKVERETPDPAMLFKALRAEQDVWFVRGRDKGVRFDLETSIAIATTLRNRATSPDERGAALNDLGIALVTLGERESDTARLEQAVAAYSAALEERTRDRVPLNWAMTQNNLGNALATLGARESGTARLEQAVAAYRAALEERTRDRVPLDWAATQNNLGNALQTLGERESGTARLEQAVTAYRAALKEWTRDRVPLGWAATQNNLGTALKALGERESGTARLEQAVAAFRAALEERTRDRVPLDWAMTQYNIAEAEIAVFEKTGDPAHLDHAEDHANAARPVFAEAQASHYLGFADAILAQIATRRAAP